MERLTKRNPDGSAYFVSCFQDDAPCGGGSPGEDCMECRYNISQASRLAAYEDTGLEPVDIQQAVDMFSTANVDVPKEIIGWVNRATWHCRKVNELRKELNVYKAIGSVDELTALVKARDEGQESNDPLTLEELRGMLGQWVWIVAQYPACECQGWAIVAPGYLGFLEQTIPFDFYGKIAVAYSRPPEAEAALRGGGE